MNNRIRYTADSILRNRFYQMPQFLFAEEFDELNNDARVLYSLLKDRHELSLKNKWLNNNGEVFLIMTREEMCKLLRISIKPTIKAVNLLIKYNLLEEERRGQGNPNLIYLMECKECQFLNCQNDNSRTGNNTSLELSKCHAINTNDNNTDFNNTNSINLSEIEAKKKQVGNPSMDMIDEINTYTEIIKENINYDALLERNPNNTEQVKEIFENIIEIITSPKKTIRVAGSEQPKEIVKSKFLKLSYQHIEYVLMSLAKNTSKVNNIKSYLTTSLYNAPNTINSYYNAEVNHDIYGNK